MSVSAGVRVRGSYHIQAVNNYKAWREAAKMKHRIVNTHTGAGVREQTATWGPVVTLLVLLQLGLVGDALAAPENDFEGPQATVSQTGQPHALFMALGPVPSGQLGNFPRRASVARPHSTVEPSAGVLRSRSAGVDVPQLATLREAVAQGRPAQVRLNLFPDVNLNAVLERTGDMRSGYSLSGRVEGQPHSSVTFVVNGNVFSGAVHAQHGTYVIAYRNGAVHTIREITGDLECGLAEGSRPSLTGRPDLPTDPDGFVGLEGPPRRAAVGVRSGLWPRGAAAGDDGSEVDLLVLFTEAALDAEGGLQQMRATIDLALTWANDAYEASGVETRLNLIAAVQVAYEESNVHGGAGLFNQREDLNRLIDPEDGFMDEAHALRDRYAADVTHLIVDQSGGGGKAQILRTNAEDPAAWAFSVSNSLSYYPTFLAHEVGHVMGLLHDRYAEGRVWDSLLPYAYGYVNQRAFEGIAPEESRWYTIMAYRSQCVDQGFECRRLQRFSNANQRYPAEIGDPLGVPGDQRTDSVDGPADAVRSLNENRHLIAAFRQSATRCDYRLSRERQEVPASGGVFSVEVDTTYSCPWTATAFKDFVSVTSNAAGRVSYRVKANDGPARVGYVVVGGETLSVYQSGRVAPASVCARTPQVRDAIVSATSRECGAISEFDLLDVAALDLQRQGITTLDAGDFTGLRNARELRLEWNRISTIPEQAFKDLVNLRELDLRGTGLTTVPAAVRGMPSLQQLSLAYNDIQDVPREAFSGLSQLRWLRLQDNQITTLPDGVFSALENLRYLELHSNRITEISKEVLQGPLDLIRVNLKHNPLGELREDVFANIPDVLQVTLDGTHLETVPRATFAGLTRLTWLGLSDNRIDDISGIIFPGNSIGSLDLGNNALSAIPSGMFAGFTSAICARRQMDLNLAGNPGSPFPLTLELDRVDAARTAAGPASVVVRVREGMPWPITVQVAATGGSSFRKEVTIENGSVESEPFDVPGGDLTELRLVEQPEVPATYKGIRMVLGDTLRLF